MTQGPVIARPETQSRPALAGPAFVVHTLAHAAAALTAAASVDQDIVLLSAADAGLYAGAGWWVAMIATARAAVPTARCFAILDCGDDSGAAQAAIRAGAEAIVFNGRPGLIERLAEIAALRGSRLFRKRPAAQCDLERAFFASSETLFGICADALASGATFCYKRETPKPIPGAPR